MMFDVSKQNHSKEVSAVLVDNQSTNDLMRIDFLSELLKYLLML